MVVLIIGVFDNIDIGCLDFRRRVPGWVLAGSGSSRLIDFALILQCAMLVAIGVN